MSYNREDLVQKKRWGFSLAEILLTITIIGIIASLSISGFITNIQNKDLKVRSKKAFSTLSEATALLSINGNGTINLGSDGTGSGARTSYGTILRYIKTGNASQFNGRYPIYYKSSGLDDLCWEGTSYCPSAILSDGTFLTFFEEWDQSCHAWGQPTLCGVIEIDVNGPYNGPNMEGYDVFFVELNKYNSNYQLQVLGSPQASTVVGCVAGGNNWDKSEGCGYNILLDNLP